MKILKCTPIFPLLVRWVNGTNHFGLLVLNYIDSLTFGYNDNFNLSLDLISVRVPTNDM